ncbi:homocysteine S-methyltransferase family protein [Pseudoponticoccus marisrubri]|uniref:DNA helicase RuvA n=1 Tax=Pseudoponticoccus marisrubri TaxID=1685382 RepID=A0A0W7WGM0_9RHOB|nr:homocysteine S-methyltransferase family protein [Pseudoponticoccus marisrubri]KUF09718.1 DNA helicase RuvA [Pseudoponticoccus marisrubri]
MTVPFTPHAPGALYITEGGTETELLYRHGFTFDHFAAFTLLDDPRAMVVLHDMYRRLLDVIAASGGCALLAGLDYRASPDWAGLLGLSPAALADLQARNIGFLREVAAPYRGDLAQKPDIRIAGIVGPRGDAYALNRAITADAAEDYHAVQLETLAGLQVDLVWAATINNIPEAVGISRAAAAAGLAVNISWTLTETHRLRSGPTLAEAVAATDAQAGTARPDSFGINCSHPAEFAPALTPGAWQGRLRCLRPNAAAMDKIALCKLDHLEEGDPVDLAARMGALARRLPSVDIWGGCCGTWDTHLARIAEQVQAARVPAQV